MKKILASGLSAAALVACSLTWAPAAHADQTTTPVAGHGTGLDLDKARSHFSDPATARKIGPMRAVRTATSIPASYDLSRYALTAGNQGRVNSCVGWAIGYSGYGVLMSEQKISGAPMAPMYLYAQMVRGNDVGTWGGGMLELATEQGIDTRAHYSHGDYDYWSQPNASERANAANYKLSGYQELPLQGDAAKQAIMRAIASGSPVPIGMQIRSSFNNISGQDPVYRGYGAVQGGHETTIVGYDANGVKVLNSWGEDWGDNGYYTMPWDFVNWGDLTEMHAMGAVVGGNPLPTPDDPTPTPQPTVDPQPTTDPTTTPTVDPQPGTNVVVNGGFEDGSTGWSGNVNRVSTNPAEPAHSGNGKLWLAGTGRAGVQYEGQQVTIPANGKFSAWVHVDTDETENQAYDTARIDLVNDDNQGPTLAAVSNLDAKDGYVQVTADLSKYAGRTMWLRFSSSEDDNRISSFTFDDVVIS